MKNQETEITARRASRRLLSGVATGTLAMAMVCVACEVCGPTYWHEIDMNDPMGPVYTCIGTKCHADEDTLRCIRHETSHTVTCKDPRSGLTIETTVEDCHSDDGC